MKNEYGEPWHPCELASISVAPPLSHRTDDKKTLFQVLDIHFFDLFFLFMLSAAGQIDTEKNGGGDVGGGKRRKPLRYYAWPRYVL